MRVAYDDIRPGDRVTMLVHAGLGLRNGKAVPEYKPKTGRVVMLGPAGPVLNLGGKHGTPGVCTPDAFVKASRPS